MDIPREESVARKKRMRRFIYGGVTIALLVVVTLGLARLQPAAPSVDRSTLLIEPVKRGLMLRQVRGPGNLVPEEIRWIPAVTQGRVERRLVLPGTTVTANTIILELSNPDVEQSFVDAELQLKAAEADTKNLRAQLDTELLNQRAIAATVLSDYRQAKLQAEVDTQLAKEGLQSELLLKKSVLRAEELKTRNEIEEQRLAVREEAVKARLAAQQAQVAQKRALYDLRRKQLDSLKVRAGVDGTLQLLPVDVGQQVTIGTNLARVANPHRLKAEIRIAETQAKDVLIGQVASIDTRNGVVPGRVTRIDPSVQNGTRTVDVTMEGPLPSGAVPDLSVDGTIELERLPDVMYISRPVQGQANSTVGLFKVSEDGSEAVRVQVKLGRSSVTTIEVLEGLKVGDRVILSDMSAQDAVNRIRLQ
jgi:HlyD family secretion protein